VFTVAIRAEITTVLSFTNCIATLQTLYTVTTKEQSVRAKGRKGSCYVYLLILPST
jgi:hypothetical protein